MILCGIIGDWDTTRCRHPHGYWKYLHQGGGRWVCQENFHLLQSVCTSGDSTEGEDTTAHCDGLKPAPAERRLDIGLNSTTRSTITAQRSTRSTGPSGKISAGRRLADLFIESGTADQTAFRQWFALQEDLREEYEEFVYSKKWKELVDDAILIMSEDFIQKKWEEILKINNQFMHFDETFYYGINESINWLKQILLHNSISFENFVEDVKLVMNKDLMKINGIWLWGATNAGKSLIANSIVESFRFFVCVNEFDEFNQFPLNDAPGKSIILINEPSIADRRIELMKNILEGQRISINVKHKSNVSLPRTPVVICSNEPLWRFCPYERTTIENRLKTYTFKTFPLLLDCKKKLHPMLWCQLLNGSTLNLDKEIWFKKLVRHRNWNIEYFPSLQTLDALSKFVDDNLHVEISDEVHLSLKNSCYTCNLSCSLFPILDPVYDVSPCMTCNEPTQFIFCNKCIS